MKPPSWIVRTLHFVIVGAYFAAAAHAQGSLINGENHTGAISVPREEDSWTFHANAGDSIALSVAETSEITPTFFPWLRLRDPNGAQVAETKADPAAQISARALLAGTYTLVVASGTLSGNDTDGTGTYSLTMAKTPGAFVVPSGDEGGALTNGANHPGTIHLGDLDMWTFHANAGDAITLSIGETSQIMPTFFPWIRLRDPNGAELLQAKGGLAAQINISNAPLSGTYTVVAGTQTITSPSINGAGTYVLTLANTPGAFLVSAGDEGGGLTAGPNNPGTIHMGDLDMWTFQANAGDAVSLTMTETSEITPTFFPWIRLRAPSGTELAQAKGNSSAQISITAPAAGTYTVVAGTQTFTGSSVEGAGTYLLASSHSSIRAPSANKLLGPDCEGAVYCGNPINITSGNKYHEVSDYETAGPNALGFTRHYNSMADPDGPPGMLGKNWRSTFDRTLYFISASSLIAERHTGQALQFSLNGAAWMADTDIDLKLTQSGSGIGSTWTLTGRSDFVETYTATSAGQAVLTSIRARNGYTQTINRGTGGEIQSITDSFGRTLQFTYENGLVRTLTTPDNLILTYGYSGGRLISASYSTTPPTGQTYLYENPSFPSALTGIVDENGERFAAWTYDASGRAVSSEHAGGANRTAVVYNANGTRTVTNALGQSETYTFTVLQGVPKVTRIDRLATATTAAASRSFTYDASGYAASETDWNGNLTTYVNDARGLPVRITEGAGTPQERVTTAIYHGTFHLPLRIVRPDLTVDFTYDAAGNLLTRTETDTTSTTVPYPTTGERRTWSYAWSNGLLTSIDGPRTGVSDVTRFAYDAGGRLTSVTNALGHVTRITAHMPGGLPLTIADPNGVTTQLAYDARLRLTSSTVNTGAGPLTTEFAYDAAGNLLRTTLPGGSAIIRGYDKAHRLIRMADLFGQEIEYTLDALGNRTFMSVLTSGGTEKRRASAAFDAIGRMISDTGGAGQTTRYSYDHAGNPVGVTDPLSRITQQVFDPLHRLIESMDPAGGSVTTVHDANDRPVRVTAPNGAVTEYVYNGFGDVIQEQSPDSGTTVYRYDSVGNLMQKTDAAGAVVNYSYDALNRVLSASYLRSRRENIAYRYDEPGHGFGIGRLTSLTDAAGRLSRSYDERGNLLAESRSSDRVALRTSYAYDAAGRSLSITYPSGAIVNYSRDAMGRTTDVTLKPGAAASVLTVLTGIAYEPFGPVNALTYGNGVAGTRSFDADYRQITLADAGIQSLTYNYDAADNVSSIADGVRSANSQSFVYDALDRVTGATGAYGSLAWTYDPNGNRLTETSGAVTSSYTYTPGTNRLAQIRTGADARQSFSYTAAGNIERVVNVPGIRPITNYGYNQAGRLEGVRSGPQQLEYEYDAFGQRIIKSGSLTGTTLYTYGPGGELLEEADGTGAARADYIYLDGRPVATFQPSTGQLYFLHTDRLGTPQAATDGAKAIAWRADYKPFGETSTVTGSIVQNLRFPGQEFEAEVDFYHNGFRDYVPRLGRYLESDPVGLDSGLNVYTYVDGNPLNQIDPLGLMRLKYCSSYELHLPNCQAGGLFGGGGGGGRSRSRTTRPVATPPARTSTPAMPAEQCFPSRERSVLFRQGTFADETVDWKGNYIKGRYWATENPLFTPDFAQKYGLPIQNTQRPDWIVGGRIRGPYKTGPAPASHNHPSNRGGAIEVRPENPEDVRLEWFHMPD